VKETSNRRAENGGNWLTLVVIGTPTIALIEAERREASNSAAGQFRLWSLNSRVCSAEPDGRDVEKIDSSNGQCYDAIFLARAWSKTRVRAPRKVHAPGAETAFG